MNFVAQVEEQLRDLGTESRKKHPGVKEASERAILQLRTLQNRYVVAVRAATSSKSPHPTTSLFRSQDILRPFLLATNYPDASFKLVTLALNAFQVLLSADAVCPEDGVHIVRVLSIQANVCCAALTLSKLGAASPGSAAITDHYYHTNHAGADSTAHTTLPFTSESRGAISTLGSSIMTGFSGILGGGSSKNNATSDPSSKGISSAGGYSSSAGHTGNSSTRTNKEDEAISIRLLQTLTMIVDSKGLDLSDELLSQCFSLCLVLISVSRKDSHDGPIMGAAATTSNTTLSQKLSFSSKNHNITSLDGMGTTGNSSVSGHSSNVYSYTTSGSASSANKVRRAAIATLKQIIATVFDRAAASLDNANNYTTIEHDDTTINTHDENQNHQSSSTTLLKKQHSQYDESGIYIQILASRIFIDLCVLAESKHFHSSIDEKSSSSSTSTTTTSINQSVSSLNTKQNKLVGPLAHALTGGGGMPHQRLQPPPRSACFDLLEMIIQQHVKIFISSPSLPPSSSSAKNDVAQSETDVQIPNFPALLRNRLCPLLYNTLATEFNSGLDKRELSSLPHISEKDIYERGDNPTSFALLLIVIKLVSSIITIYGGDKYAHAVDRHSLGVRESSLSMQRECHVLVITLVRFIKAATELFRDSHDFEDGYIYNNIKDSIVDNSSSATKGRVSSANVLPPSQVLWRASVALDFLYTLVSDHPDTLMALEKSTNSMNTNETTDERQNNPMLVAMIIEALSDFAVVSSSSRDGILQVVASSQHKNNIELLTFASSSRDGIDYFAEQEKGYNSKESWGGISLSEAFNSLKRIDPMISTKARNAVKLFDGWENDSARYISQGKYSDTEKYDHRVLDMIQTDNFIQTCGVGDAVWVSLNSIVCIWYSLWKTSTATGNNATQNENHISSSYIKELIRHSFVSSLAIMQHFLKRFPASQNIVKCALSGYIFLANCAIPLRDEDDMKRRAILTSICRLALPSWGKQNNSSVNLQDSHIASLSAILQIIHYNYNDIGKDWQIILLTFQQLSCIHISSSNLTEDGMSAAVAISDSLCRFPKFSKILSNKCMIDLIDDVVTLPKTLESKSSGEFNVRNDDTMNVVTSGLSTGKKGSLGFMSLAGRALSGVGGNLSQENDSQLSEHDVVSSRLLSTKTYGDEFCWNLHAKLIHIKPNTQKDILRKLPFSLLIFFDVIIENFFRFQQLCKAVSSELCELSSSSENSEIRMFALDAFSYLITGTLDGITLPGKSKSGHELPLKNLKNIDDCFSVESVVGNDSVDNPADVQKSYQENLLDAFCRSITITNKRDTVEAGLNILHILLEGAGHNLSDKAWVTIIEAITASSGYQEDSSSYSDRSSSEWATCCTLAFRCLKLIVDDFLDHLIATDESTTNETLTVLLDCCAAFGSSTHDVNISLTATGMLWTIADQDPTPSSVDLVLSKLAYLSTDGRQEVRNCSVNTLFSCMVGLGNKFTSEQWRRCFCGTIFGVLDQVISQGSENRSEDKSSTTLGVKNPSDRYRVSVHHSRDSSSKQWATTQVLILRGIERVFRQYFNQLVSTIDVSQLDADADDEILGWFTQSWYRILDFAFECSILPGGRDTLDVRLAGIDTMVLCSQVSSESGISAATGPARVGTNMQVVNGALRKVRAATSVSVQSSLSLNETETIEFNSKKRDILFNQAFNTLLRYGGYLDENAEELSAGESPAKYTETTLVQVLTRLIQGLSKLYQCCKSNELSPNQTTSSENIWEYDFIDLIEIIILRAGSSPDSKYLSHAQRTSLELLQSMASNSSCQALNKLTELGGDAFWRQVNDSSSDDSENIMSSDNVLQLEAMKCVSESCCLEDVPKEAKTEASFRVMTSFIDHHTPLQKQGIKICHNYKNLQQVICSGLRSASSLEAEGMILTLRDVTYDLFWTQVIKFLDLLVSISENIYKEADDFIDILDVIVECTPVKIYEEVAEVFGKCAETSVMISKVSDNDAKSALNIFQRCFMGIGTFIPKSEFILSLSLSLLQNVRELFSEAPSATRLSNESSSSSSHIEIEIATLVCRLLCTFPNICEISIELFPCLCHLINVDDASLRKAVTAVIEKADLSGVLTRLKNAEEKANISKDLEEEMEKVSLALKEEKNRADDASSRLEQVEREMEVLKRKNEKLERQLAVVLEGSAYT